MSRVLMEDHDATVRLGTDDMATLHEEQLRQVALLERQRRAAQQRSTPGTCSNCGAECLPAAVYCDEDCRGDHERRLRVQRLLGSGG